MVHVYGKPGCVQCKFTNDLLDKEGQERQYHDITVEADAEAIVRGSGRLELPFVVADDQQWHGFRPDKIRSLKQLVSA